MLILGHRGASSAHPENTLEAFAAAYEGGAQGLEFDVRGDRDNVPVLSHDRSLDRRAGDPRNVDELSLAELKTLDVGQGYHMPTLAEALALAGGRGFLDIEVKQAGIEREILAALKGYRGQWGISSFDWSSLEAFRALDREVKLWLLGTQFSDSMFSTALRLSAVGIAMHHSQLNESTVAQCNEAGLSVIGWTVNDAAEAQRLADLGVHAICTDVPELLYMIGKAN
ncbi:MAG: glycerophosphodiester phosphodiesterase [Thermomicrobiales bacterium]|nr:glycerophosphodiester phosphodiesterase [Thermomicrobiales bacterium]